MKIAIAGYGVEGNASYYYWLARSGDGDEVTIVDEREAIDGLPDGAATMLGHGVFERLDGFDIVVRTPGIDPHRIQTDGRIWSATNEFMKQCPAPIIGVTGTKGKGTTCSLIASILRAAGHTVYLVGNIGVPALKVLPDITPQDIVVYELSSFQLWDAEASPHIAVVLMIEPDHLDIHADMDDYIAAKSQIALHQSSDDIIIYNHENTYSRQVATSSAAKTRIKIPFDISGYVSDLQIPGRHNHDNAAAAIAAARIFTDDDAAIHRGLAEFHGLPHRLAFVAEVDGVRYYDDSIGTTPGSARAALAAFEQQKVLILGGSEKGADYSQIVELCGATNTKIIAIGETGETIAELAQKYGVICERLNGRMDEVVKKAHEVAHDGDVVILSPASASFDQYKNYADRGDQFVAAVKSLAD